MFTLAEILFFVVITLLSITEFFYPLLFGKPFFGSFRKKKIEPVVEKPKVDPVDLKGKVIAAKDKVREVKKVQDEVTEFHKQSEELKGEADDLLK